VAELPVVTGAEAVRAFERLGFEKDRRRGSHQVLVKPGHRFHLSVPVHRGKNLKPGTLRALLKAAGITVEEFRAAL
jgi:predicted RNA binding protein YcfA (HicA-like mRNA interferase family)